MTLTNKALVRVSFPNNAVKQVADDLQIIDEILFIENEHLIKRYHDRKVKADEEEMESLRVRNSL